MMEQGLARQSLLHSLVTESLFASPEDAHIKLLGHLNLSENDASIFKQAWSESKLRCEAFRPKDSSGKVVFDWASIDISKFASDFIDALTSRMKVAQLLQQHKEYLFTKVLKSNLENTNSNQAQQSNDTCIDYMKNKEYDVKLDGILTSMYECRGFETVDFDDLSSPLAAVIQAKEIYRNYSIIWNSGKSLMTTDNFVPLIASSATSGGGGFEVRLRFGELIHAKPSRRDSSAVSNAAGGAPSTSYNQSLAVSQPSGARGTGTVGGAISLDGNMVVGIEVSNTPDCSSDLWASWSCLDAMRIGGEFDIFPKPITVSTEGGTKLLFAFERADGLRSISSLYGTELAKELRKQSDIVIMHWCHQLAISAYCLFNFQILSVLGDCFDSSSVFVSEEGNLVLGNLLLEERSGPADKDEEKNQRISMERLLEDIVQNSLAISRTVTWSHKAFIESSKVQESTVYLVSGCTARLFLSKTGVERGSINRIGSSTSTSMTSSNNNSNNNNNNNNNNNSSSSIGSSPGKAAVIASTDTSNLRLSRSQLKKEVELINGEFSIQIRDDSSSSEGGESSKKDSSSASVVEVSGFEVFDGDAAECLLTARAALTTSAACEISVYSTTGSGSSSSTLLWRIKLVVLPNIAANSTALQELILYNELSFQSDGKCRLYNASSFEGCFSSPGRLSAKKSDRVRNFRRSLVQIMFKMRAKSSSSTAISSSWKATLKAIDEANLRSTAQAMMSSFQMPKI